MAVLRCETRRSAYLHYLIHMLHLDFFKFKFRFNWFISFLQWEPLGLLLLLQYGFSFHHRLGFGGSISFCCSFLYSECWNATTGYSQGLIYSLLVYRKNRSGEKAAHMAKPQEIHRHQPPVWHRTVHANLGAARVKEVKFFPQIRAQVGLHGAQPLCWPLPRGEFHQERVQQREEERTGREREGLEVTGDK